jgi:hypothetical protein
MANLIGWQTLRTRVQLTSGRPARGYLRRIFSIALPLASSSMSLSR